MGAVFVLRFRSHIRLLTLVTIAWALFWVGGLPDYYRQYSMMTMIIFDLVILPPICFLVLPSIKRAEPGKALTIAFWWAFYIAVPLFIYDFLYTGVYLGHGLDFLRIYWYLTVYYILPWLIFPSYGVLVEKGRSTEADRSKPYA